MSACFAYGMSRPGRLSALTSLAWVTALSLCGCPAPPTALAKAQEVAREFNEDARFGRMELTLEHVAPAARDSFAERHRAWGSGVRIADLELAGIRSRGDHDLCVFVRVAWYRPEEQELRTTTVQQDWHDTGGWQLMAEQRVDGDVGLLGEAVAPSQVAVPRPAARFPTVRLGGGAVAAPE